MNAAEEKKEALDSLVKMVDDSEISSIKKIVSGIISIINNPGSTIKDLKELIEVDPPLTASVLRMANSAYYSSGKKISEIEEAVIWIGFDELKELALRQKVCEIFARDEAINGYSRTLLWKHSVAVALLAKLIYRREYGERGDNIYAAGLLHDIGIIVEDQFLHGDFEPALQRGKDERNNLVDSECEVFGYQHADVGRALAVHWSFPGELVTSIGNHHGQFEAPHTFPRIDLALFVANYLCQVNNIGFCDSPYPDEVTFHRCLNALGLEPVATNLIVEELKKEIIKMEDQGLL